MNAKEFLSQAYLIDQRIQSKTEQIEALTRLSKSCTSVLSGMPHNPSKSASPMADAVSKIIDLEDEVAREMEHLVEIKKEIVDVIGEVNDVMLRTLLEKRYLCGETWEEITIALNCNRRWTMRLHDRALASVQRILNEKFFRNRPQ